MNILTDDISSREEEDCSSSSDDDEVAALVAPMPHNPLAPNSTRSEPRGGGKPNHRAAPPPKRAGGTTSRPHVRSAGLARSASSNLSQQRQNRSSSISGDDDGDGDSSSSESLPRLQNERSSSTLVPEKPMNGPHHSRKFGTDLTNSSRNHCAVPPSPSSFSFSSPSSKPRTARASSLTRRETSPPPPPPTTSTSEGSREKMPVLVPASSSSSSLSSMGGEKERSSSSSSGGGGSANDGDSRAGGSISSLLSRGGRSMARFGGGGGRGGAVERSSSLPPPASPRLYQRHQSSGVVVGPGPRRPSQRVQPLDLRPKPPQEVQQPKKSGGSRDGARNEKEGRRRRRPAPPPKRSESKGFSEITSGHDRKEEQDSSGDEGEDKSGRSSNSDGDGGAPLLARGQFLTPGAKQKGDRRVDGDDEGDDGDGSMSLTPSAADFASPQPFLHRPHVSNPFAAPQFFASASSSSSEVGAGFRGGGGNNVDADHAVEATARKSNDGSEGPISAVSGSGALVATAESLPNGEGKSNSSEGDNGSGGGSGGSGDLLFAHGDDFSALMADLEAIERKVLVNEDLHDDDDDESDSASPSPSFDDKGGAETASSPSSANANENGRRHHRRRRTNAVLTSDSPLEAMLRSHSDQGQTAVVAAATGGVVAGPSPGVVCTEKGVKPPPAVEEQRAEKEEKVAKLTMTDELELEGGQGGGGESENESTKYEDKNDFCGAAGGDESDDDFGGGGTQAGSPLSKLVHNHFLANYVPQGKEEEGEEEAGGEYDFSSAPSLSLAALDPRSQHLASLKVKAAAKSAAQALAYSSRRESLAKEREARKRSMSLLGGGLGGGAGAGAGGGNVCEAACIPEEGNPLAMTRSDVSCVTVAAAAACASTPKGRINNAAAAVTPRLPSFALPPSRNEDLKGNGGGGGADDRNDDDDDDDSQAGSEEAESKTSFSVLPAPALWQQQQQQQQQRQHGNQAAAEEGEDGSEHSCDKTGKQSEGGEVIRVGVIARALGKSSAEHPTSSLHEPTRPGRGRRHHHHHSSAHGPSSPGVGRRCGKSVHGDAYAEWMNAQAGLKGLNRGLNTRAGLALSAIKQRDLDGLEAAWRGHGQRERGGEEEGGEKESLEEKSHGQREIEGVKATGGDVDARDDFGNTLLSLCARAGWRQGCHSLLRGGADLSARNLNGNTALHFACEFGPKGKVEALLVKCARKQQRKSRKDREEDKGHDGSEEEKEGGGGGYDEAEGDEEDECGVLAIENNRGLRWNERWEGEHSAENHLCSHDTEGGGASSTSSFQKGLGLLVVGAGGSTGLTASETAGSGSSRVSGGGEASFGEGGSEAARGGLVIAKGILGSVKGASAPPPARAAPSPPPLCFAPSKMMTPLFGGRPLNRKMSYDGDGEIGMTAKGINGDSEDGDSDEDDGSRRGGGW